METAAPYSPGLGTRVHRSQDRCTDSNPQLPTALKYGVVLTSYTGPHYRPRYIPESMASGTPGRYLISALDLTFKNLEPTLQKTLSPEMFYTPMYLT